MVRLWYMMLQIWYMIVTDLWSSRGESTTSKVGFYPGNMQQQSKQLELVVR